jgi:broad specificity phosphatase PhoE
MEALIIQGSIGGHLSARGQAEAQKTSRELSKIQFDAIYSSPLSRARETAEIVCASTGKTPLIVDELREMDCGWYEGKPDFTMKSKNTGVARKLELISKFLLIQLSGESFWAVKKRVRQGWEKIRHLTPQGTILIVAHGISMDYLIKMLVDRDQISKDIYMFSIIKLEPCSLSEIVLEDDGSSRLVRVNDTSHLG